MFGMQTKTEASGENLPGYLKMLSKPSANGPPSNSSKDLTPFFNEDVRRETRERRESWVRVEDKAVEEKPKVWRSKSGELVKVQMGAA